MAYPIKREIKNAKQTRVRTLRNTKVLFKDIGKCVIKVPSGGKILLMGWSRVLLDRAIEMWAYFIKIVDF